MVFESLPKDDYAPTVNHDESDSLQDNVIPTRAIVLTLVEKINEIIEELNNG